ncbi:DNA alkylation repair protein [Agriterribacter humi]|uniref:DNA alkylation repair protein n=1 Tax=Agriterribacter humi TaxID=1104781 RepID=UPI00126459D0|nr:DNA alkylation repair protein [Agriterribacter humi]
MPTSSPKATTGKTAVTARQFIDQLFALPVKPGADNSRFFKGDDKKNKTLKVRMADIFGLAKQFTPMPLNEIGKLLDSNYYEARLGAISIMDFQARDKKVSEEQKKALYNLYISRHNRINNWDLVDRSAPFVVGGYLFNKSRAPLYKLARSKNIWERRTSIVATWFFIRQNDTEDTFKIARLLVHDKEDLINKAVGSWIREAGKRDKQKLLAFLDEFAATMPRVTLRYAIEKLDKKQKAICMNAAK